MEKPNPRLDELMKDPRAAALLRDKAALEALLRSPDAQALMAMLSRAGEGGLKSAADAAARGDASALMGLVGQVMNTREGAAAAQRLNKRAGGG